MGKLPVDSSKHWLAQISIILAEHLLTIVPTGGPNHQLGHDDLADFAVKHLLIKDAKKCMACTKLEDRLL